MMEQSRNCAKITDWPFLWVFKGLSDCSKSTLIELTIKCTRGQFNSLIAKVQSLCLIKLHLGVRLHRNLPAGTNFLCWLHRMRWLTRTHSTFIHLVCVVFNPVSQACFRGTVSGLFWFAGLVCPCPGAKVGTRLSCVKIHTVCLCSATRH